MANQFKKLRCPEDKMKPVHTIAELEEAGVGGHSSIYKYESGESKPGYEAIKAYKHLFDCSYEYLFDEVPHPAEKHKYITDKSLLAKLNPSSIDNLEQLLTDPTYANFNTHMLNALLANPTALQNTMETIFRFMYDLNQIYTNPSLRQGEKELNASPLWFSLNQHIDIYLRDVLRPNLESGFKKFEAKNEERRIEAAKRDKEEGERVQRLYEELQKQEEEFNRKITVIVGEPIPITEESKEKEG